MARKHQTQAGLLPHNKSVKCRIGDLLAHVRPTPETLTYITALNVQGRSQGSNAVELTTKTHPFGLDTNYASINCRLPRRDVLCRWYCGYYYAACEAALSVFPMITTTTRWAGLLVSWM